MMSSGRLFDIEMDVSLFDALARKMLATDEPRLGPRSPRRSPSHVSGIYDEIGAQSPTRTKRPRTPSAAERSGDEVDLQLRRFD
jgi:hypothetical protein